MYMRSYLAVLLTLSGLTTPSLCNAWQAYGNTPGGSKYSELSAISTDNVHQLKQAWVFHTGETGEGYASGNNLTFETTPIFWNDTLYFNSSFGKVYALDAVTGKERWRFDANKPEEVSMPPDTNCGARNSRSPTA